LADKPVSEASFNHDWHFIATSFLVVVDEGHHVKWAKFHKDYLAFLYSVLLNRLAVFVDN
jgi:hypothetical protein